MKIDSNESPNKVGVTTLGVLLGGLLMVVWVGLLWFIGHTLFPHQSIISQNPVVDWLYIGPMPFLAIAGNYLMYHRRSGGVEPLQVTVELKSIFLGILIWFPITVILYFMQWDGPWQLSPIGGLLTMIIVTFLWKRSTTRRGPHENAGQE